MPASVELLEAQTQTDVIERLMDQIHKALLTRENESINSIRFEYTARMRRLVTDLERINAVFLSGNEPTYSQWKALKLDVESAQAIAREMSGFREDMVKRLGDDLNDMYRKSYNGALWAIDQTTPFNIDPKYNLPPDHNLKLLFEEPWNGQRFSDRVWAISDEWARSIQNQLIQSVYTGDSVREMASKIRQYTGVPEDAKLISRPRASAQLYRATLIARTELIRAGRMAQDQAYEDNSDIIDDKEWSAKPGLLGVCEICREKNGHTPSEIEKMGLPLEGHPNCVLPGQTVISPDVFAASKAFYRGPIVKISLSSGAFLSVTSNHPVATPDGWVRAKELVKGQNLIGNRGFKNGPLASYPDDKQVPVLVEDVFGSLKKSTKMVSRLMELSPEDFHGEAAFFDGNVDVIDSKGHLRTNHDSFLLKFVRDFKFNLRNVGCGGFSCLSYFGSMLKRLLGAPNSGLSLFDSFFSLSKGHTCTHSEAGLGLVPRLNTGIQEPPADHVSGNGKLLRQFQFAHSTDIFLDQIIDIQNDFYIGHVYDLQSKEFSLYNCNGVIVSNCRCVWIPKMKSWEEMLAPAIKDIKSTPGKISRDLMIEPDQLGKWKPVSIEPYQEWKLSYLTPDERGEK